MMESNQSLASPMSPNTTGTGADEDTIGSITKDFSSNFAHKFTPLTWSKNLQTPTPTASRLIDSNMSSITCFKHANFNGENETPMVNQTPMRDLNPDYQDGPNVHCPLSVDSQISSSSLESPPVVKVLSPATQFRLKRAVFESKAKAVKSPNRKQRAQNVTALEGSPSLPLMMYTDNDISPSCAIESELGEEESEETSGMPTAQAMPISVTMKVMQNELITESDEINEKEYAELQYEPPVTKEDLVMLQTEEKNEVLPARMNTHSKKPVMYLLLALLMGVLYYSSASFLNPSVVSVSSVSSTELPLAYEATTEPLTQPEAVASTTDFEEVEHSEMGVQDAEMSLSVVYKSAFLQEVIRARALYVQFRQVCTTQLARLQGQIHAFDAAHGSHLHKATVQLRDQADVYLAELGESVVQFHHQIDALGIKHEYLKLKDEVSTRVAEYMEKSGANELLALAKQKYQVHAPIVQQRVAAEVQKAQQHTVTKMLQLHHFIKANELLADEFY